MTINHVLAVVAVSDFDTSHAWYQRLFDTPATNIPMPDNLAEWRVTDAGWLQVFHDPKRAGTSMVNFAVADLDRQHADLHAWPRRRRNHRSQQRRSALLGRRPRQQHHHLHRELP